ncbi:MAG TPA: aldo/keto reductase [Propionibacteriaceae bacterium]
MRTLETSVPIGLSDLHVHPLALGGNVFGWTASEAVSHNVLDAFYNAGGNFVDTADVYSVWAPGNAGGESENILGLWLSQRGNREHVVVATKVSQHPNFPGLSADNVRAAAEASLNRLSTDYIDLYYAHFDDEQTPLEETAAAFDALVRSGKVRHIGLSNYRADRVAAWLRIADEQGYARPVALQPGYNLVDRGGYESELAPLAVTEQLGVLPYYGLASGFLTGKYRTTADLEGAARSGAAGKYLNEAGLGVLTVLDEVAAHHDVEPATVALAWLRTRPGVVAPIASARTADQLPALLASATLDLSSDEVSALDAASA